MSSLSKKKHKGIQSPLLKKFEKKINISFNDKTNLQNALTHSSYLNENSEVLSNEKLEFLGDSILGFVINEYLYHSFPNMSEGDLAKIKNSVVCEESLADLGRTIDLGNFLFMGKGELRNGGNDRDSILADGVEALIAAIYLDQGLLVTRDFILDYLVPQINHVEHSKYKKDYKSFLQELTQKKWQQTPDYEVLSEVGPEHQKIFEVRVCILGKVIGSGKGSSKKKAEQSAAAQAIHALEQEGILIGK